MNIFLLSLGAFAGAIGVIGSIVPILPGPLLTYSTLFILYYIGGEDLIPVSRLIYTGIAALTLVAFSSFIPIATTKLTGSSMSGVYGSIVGAIVGLIMFPPLGMFIGATLGAVIGEYYSFGDIKRSVNAGIGATIGAIFVMLIQAIFSISIFIYFIFKALSLF